MDTGMRDILGGLKEILYTLYIGIYTCILVSDSTDT
jgi:hypothetical protein